MRSSEDATDGEAEEEEEEEGEGEGTAVTDWMAGALDGGVDGSAADTARVRRRRGRIGDETISSEGHVASALVWPTGSTPAFGLSASTPRQREHVGPRWPTTPSAAFLAARSTRLRSASVSRAAAEPERGRLAGGSSAGSLTSQLRLPRPIAQRARAAEPAWAGCSLRACAVCVMARAMRGRARATRDVREGAGDARARAGVAMQTERARRVDYGASVGDEGCSPRRYAVG